MLFRSFVSDQRCQACHVAGGEASPIAGIRIQHDPGWLIAHARDPEVIAPGMREPPPGGMSEGQARSIASYMRKARMGTPLPEVPAETLMASLVIGRYCASCHMVDGEGGSTGPDLSRIGATRDAVWLRDWITEPEAVDPFANMPAFGDTLSEEEMKAVVAYLSARR